MESTSLGVFASAGMLIDMTIGMVLGMVASPLMMKGIKILNQRRKLDRLLQEIAENRRKSPVMAETTDSAL